MEAEDWVAPASLSGKEDDLEERVLRTLRLFSRWGHAATVSGLAASLLGGPVEPPELRHVLQGMEDVALRGDLVGLSGEEDLLAKTDRRRQAHADLEATYLQVAEEFCHDLVSWCPFVQSVALTGSLASGGFAEGDDVDFDLLVERETKYICYLLGNLLGLKYAWRFRRREVNGHHSTPLLPKITCLNVVWPEDEARPFARRDEAMAFELLRCQPLMGVEHFAEVLDANPWLREYFPQVYERSWEEVVPNGATHPVGKLLGSLRRFPRALDVLEAVSRSLSWALYRFVQWSRRNDDEAVRRMEFLRDVKYPYEVFQD